MSDDYFIDRLTHVKSHIQAYRQGTGKNIPITTLELGAGWYPIVPLSFFVMGSDEMYTIDLKQFVNKKRLIECISKFLDFHTSGRIQEYLEVDMTRIDTLKGILESRDSLKLEEILHKLKIKLLIRDARTLDFSDYYFDLIHSNNTFEHIHPQILVQIIKEFKRILKKDGVMSHFIDMSDHFAHFDTSISIYNFLKFSDKEWRMIDNSIQPQNRLRIYDYEEMFKQLKIDYKIINTRAGNTDELNNIKIDNRFKNIDQKLVAVSHCQFIIS